MGFIPYFAGNVFTIPSPDAGSIPFVPNVDVVLKFLQGKIGIFEAFYKDTLTSGLSSLSSVNTAPVASVGGAKAGAILPVGGPSFGDQQPPSPQSAITNAQNSFLSTSVAPSGVGLEAIEILIIRLFGEGFKPVMEMVLIILDLLKVIEDVICRILGFVNPAYIPWSLNAVNIQLDLVRAALNEPQVPNTADIDNIQEQILAANNLSNNAVAAIQSLANTPNLSPQQQETLDQLKDLVNCAKCDVNVLQKQLDVYICNLQDRPVAKPVYPDLIGQPETADLSGPGDNIGAYQPIKSAIYLGYYDRNGVEVTPPKWITDSTKWIGQFDYLSGDQGTGTEQFRTIYKNHINQAASNIDTSKQYVPFSNSPQSPSNGNTIATAQVDSVPNTVTGPSATEDCGCPPETAYSDISNAMDKYLVQANESGYVWAPVASTSIDITGPLNDLNSISKNFDFVKNASDSLDSYDFNIRDSNNNVIDNMWNLAYNNASASQLGMDFPINNDPFNIPNNMKHKIMETFNIDPEMVGRIRIVKVNNLPVLPGGKQNLILESSSCAAWSWNNTITFYNVGTSYALPKDTAIGTNKDSTVFIQYKNTSLVAGTLMLLNNVLTSVMTNTGVMITFYVYGSIAGKVATGLDGITPYPFSIPADFRAVWNGRGNLTVENTIAGDPSGSIRFTKFNNGSGHISGLWSFAILPPIGWNTSEDTVSGTIFPGNLPKDPNDQLFLQPNEDPSKAPKYSDSSNTPFTINQGVDIRDIGYLTELYYLSMGYNRVPVGPTTTGTGDGIIDINESNIPTHFWLVELLPLDTTPVTPSPTDLASSTAGKNINTKQQADADNYGAPRTNKGAYIYTQIPYFFTAIPVFFAGAVNIIVGQLVPLLTKLIEILTNPSKIGDLLGGIVQQQLGENVALFAPDFTTNTAKVQSYSFLASQNSSGTTGFTSFGGRPIINTVIDGLALLVIPGFISFGFKVDKGQLSFVVQRASTCKVDEPIIQLALSMITLPFQMMITIFKGIFDFLSAIAQPWKLPAAIIEFFSFKWLLGTILPTNQLNLLGINFKTPVTPATDDPIVNNQALHDSFSADLSQLVGLITAAINNPTSPAVDATRPSTGTEEVIAMCDCLSLSNISDLSKIFPSEIQSYLNGQKASLAQALTDICACTTNVPGLTAQQIVATALNSCGINNLPPALGNGVVGSPSSGVLTDSNGMVISVPNPSAPNVNTSTTPPNQLDPYDRDGCSQTLPNTLHYLTQFALPPYSPPNFNLTIPQIMGMSIKDIKMQNPSQFAYINENTSIGQIFALLSPQLIDLSEFIKAPFISNLPVVTPQELATMIFMPIEILDSILKLFDDIINGIIAFAMGLFGVDGLFPVPKMKLHCLIPKFALVFTPSGGITVTTTGRCEDTNSGLVFLPNASGVSEIFSLGSNGYVGMDVSSFDGNPSLSDGIYTGVSAVNNYLAQIPAAVPVAEACGCDTTKF